MGAILRDMVEYGPGLDINDCPGQLNSLVGQLNFTTRLPYRASEKIIT